MGAIGIYNPICNYSKHNLTPTGIFQESKSEEPLTSPSHRLIGHLQSAHSVYDVNTVVWCPRKGYEDILATSGDDGSLRVWRVLDS